MLNSSTKRNQFAFEVESLPFLGVLLMQNNEDIITLCRKESFSDVYLHWDSFAPIS